MAAFDKLASVRDRKWVLYGASGVPIYYTLYGWYPREFFNRYGSPNDVIIVQKGKQIEFFYDGEQMEEVSKKVLPMLIAQQWGFYDQWVKEAEDFERLHYRVMDESLSSYNDEEFRSLIRQYRELFNQQFITNNIIEPLSYYFQHHLVDLLVKERLTEERARELVELYGQPAKPNYVRLAAREYKDATSPEEVATILKKYHYLNNDYTGAKPITEEDLKKLNVSEPHSRTGSDIEDISPRAQALLGVVQIIATFQDVRKAQLLMMVSGAGRFAEERARRSGIDFADMEFATWDEVENGTFDRHALQERHNGMTFYLDKDGMQLFVNKDLKEISDNLNRYVLCIQEDATEASGICASKGRAVGRAVIVTRTEEFNKVQPGDILITMMTRPEYLPIMGLAAAFVCDEGGITSHAAIVAREMKKPCVIAAKNATRVFKDGDLVEVDADRGVVAILKRA